MAWSKESRQSRGYGAAWDKLRRHVMKRDCGLCQPCRKRSIVTIATAVDHIISKAIALAMRWTQTQIDAESNLQAICDACHRRAAGQARAARWARPARQGGRARHFHRIDDS